MARSTYRLLEHTADLRLKITGRSFADLLNNAVFALADQMVEAKCVAKKLTRKVTIRAEGHDLQLVRLLQECLFRFDARGFVACGVRDVKADAKKLEALLVGENFSAERHRPKSEIKAVTLHGLKLSKKGGLLSAEIVVDV